MENRDEHTLVNDFIWAPCGGADQREDLHVREDFNTLGKTIAYAEQEDQPETVSKANPVKSIVRQDDRKQEVLNQWTSVTSRVPSTATRPKTGRETIAAKERSEASPTMSQSATASGRQNTDRGQ
uniref:Uncharacterized protein n=1 Tax=Peronospora matthiolae TaxID=2874970 RepID=A0AAV1T5Z8_9STRA